MHRWYCTELAKEHEDLLPCKHWRARHPDASAFEQDELKPAALAKVHEQLVKEIHDMHVAWCHHEEVADHESKRPHHGEGEGWVCEELARLRGEGQVPEHDAMQQTRLRADGQILKHDEL